MTVRDKDFIVDEDYRMKVVNFLKIYGYYDGVLANNEIHKKYVNGELKLMDIIQSKQDFKKLKMCIKVVLEYCYDNHYDQIENVMNHFYKVECLEIRKKYGSFFDKF